MKNSYVLLFTQIIRRYRYGLLMVAGFVLFYSCDLINDETLGSRDSFIGSYSVKQTCGGSSSSSQSYTLRISKGSGSNGVLIENLSPFPNEIEATVIGNTLSIPAQNTPLGGNPVSVSGSGQVRTDNGVFLDIDFSYQNAGNNSCKLNGYKL